MHLHKSSFWIHLRYVYSILLWVLGPRSIIGFHDATLQHLRMTFSGPLVIYDAGTNALGDAEVSPGSPCTLRFN